MGLVGVSGFTDYALPKGVGRRPSGDWLPVPPGFLSAPNAAAHFATTFTHGMRTFTGCVHLVGGAAFATDNIAAVEINVGHLPDTLFRPKDLRLLNAVKRRGTSGAMEPYPPSHILITPEGIAFSWGDGSWVRLLKRGHPVVDGYDGTGSGPKRGR